MSLFYLHLLKGDVRLVDPEGEEFTSLSEARAEAVMVLREMASDMVLNGKRPADLSIETASEAGDVLLTVSYPVEDCALRDLA